MCVRICNCVGPCCLCFVVVGYFWFLMMLVLLTGSCLVILCFAYA